MAEDESFQWRLLIVGLFLGLAGNMAVEYYMKFLEVFEMGWAHYLFCFSISFALIIYVSLRLTR